MGRKSKIAWYGCLGLPVLLLLAVAGAVGYVVSIFHIPGESTARRHFNEHRAAFVRLVDLLDHNRSIEMLEKDGSFSAIGKDGFLHYDIIGASSPEFHRLMRDIDASSALVREDRSIEFYIWGWGVPLGDDHDMGIRYAPNDHLYHPIAGWQQTVVSSLDGNKLPQENGAVASGLYVVPIDSEWFVYRFDYQE